MSFIVEFYRERCLEGNVQLLKKDKKNGFVVKVFVNMTQSYVRNLEWSRAYVTVVLETILPLL